MLWIKNRLWKSLVAVLTFSICFASVCVAEPDEILLDHRDAFPDKQRSAVTFNHALHIEGLECLACHHRYEKGKNVLDEGELEDNAPDVACVSCHKNSEKMTIKKAYHRQCMGCHMTLRKQGKPSGPELCGECHTK